MISCFLKEGYKYVRCTKNCSFCEEINISNSLEDDIFFRGIDGYDYYSSTIKSVDLSKYNSDTTLSIELFLDDDGNTCNIKTTGIESNKVLDFIKKHLC